MKIEIKKVELNYAAPISIRGEEIKKNTFLNVTFNDQDFFFSLLPNFHQTNFEEITYALNHIFPNHKSIDLSLVEFKKKYFGLIQSDLNISGEILFIIETLLLSLIKVPPFSELKINQLYNSERSLDYYQETLCFCLKIKINPSNQENILKLIADLHKINPTITFRFDGNRKFELTDLLKFVYQLKNETNYKIDYIEDPLINFNESYIFQTKSTIPLALDESLGPYLKKNLNSPLIPAIAVIKPSLYGLSPVYKWMENYPQTRCIISSSYEHPSVMSSLTFLAQNRPTEFHGLENYFSQ